MTEENVGAAETVNENDDGVEGQEAPVGTPTE